MFKPCDEIHSFVKHGNNFDGFFLQEKDDMVLAEDYI